MTMRSESGDRWRWFHFWRKVRASQGTVVGNAHRSREQGKCNRKQTADGPSFQGGSGKGETVR